MILKTVSGKIVLGAVNTRVGHRVQMETLNMILQNIFSFANLDSH